MMPQSFNAILAESTGAVGHAFGIRLNNLEEHDIITNNGTITATAPINDHAYSVWIDNYSGTGGSVTNNGILNGNIYLDGGYNTQSAAGIIQIGVDSNTVYGRLKVGETATLPDNGNIKVDVARVNTLVAGTLDDIINASTLSSGPTYNVMDNSLAWQFAATKDENTLDLTAAATGMSTYTDAVSRADFSSGTGVEGVLDEFVINGAPNSDFDELLYALGSNDTPSEVADDVSKLLPLLSGAAPQVTFNAMRITNRIIQSRLETNKSSSFGNESHPDRRMWIKPFGSWTDQDDADGAIGYDAGTYGVVSGVDTLMFNSAIRVGAALAYSGSDADSNSDVAPQSVNIDTCKLAFYSGYSLDERTDLSFQIDIDTSSYDGNRNLNFQPSIHSVANSDYDSTNYHLGSGIVREIKIDGKSTFTPSVRIDYTAIDEDSYIESGAGSYSLHVDGGTVDELIIAVDGKLRHDLNTTTSVTGNIGVVYDAINEQASSTSSFVGGGPTFTTYGVDPSSLLVRGGFDLIIQPVNGIMLVTRYDFEASEDLLNQTVSCKFRTPF